jgi:molecular chaperone DnaJ
MSQRDWMEKDFYKVLGIAKDASKDDIKRAYRRLAQRYHPDANKGNKAAEQRFKEISEAHSILSNEDKRREYDEMRRLVEAGGRRFYGFTPGGDQGTVRVNVDDIGDLFSGGAGAGGLFDDLFGFGGRRQRRGRDRETEVTLSFEEAVSGTMVALEGGAKVRVPAGVGDGAMIKVAGKGENPSGSGIAGDLYVRVHVKPHEIFELTKEGDLQIRLPISVTEAALGAKVQVPTLDGPVTVKIPAGTNSGKALRLRGRGVPKPHGKGDLLVKVAVEVPLKLSKKERELLEEFEKIHRSSPRRHLEGYVRKTAPAEAS